MHLDVVVVLETCCRPRPRQVGYAAVGGSHMDRSYRERVNPSAISKRMRGWVRLYRFVRYSLARRLARRHRSTGEVDRLDDDEVRQADAWPVPRDRKKAWAPSTTAQESSISTPHRSRTENSGPLHEQLTTALHIERGYLQSTLLRFAYDQVQGPTDTPSTVRAGWR